MLRISLLVLLVLLACGCTAETPVPSSADGRGPARQPTLITEVQENVPAVVRGVIDARTVELDSGERVRISLLAAPAECWAASAIAFARKTLLIGSVRVATVTPGEASLTLEDGTDYALLAVREGVLRAQGAAGQLAEAEVLAARENRGLWGPPCEGMDAQGATAVVPTTKRVVPPKPAATTPPPAPPVPTTTTTQPPPPAPPVPPCKVSYRIGGQWPGGFQGNVTVRNTGGSAINGWTLRWSFGDGQTVQNMWNAVSTQRGASVSAANAHYTAVIAPGGEVSLGFIGTHRGANGVPGAFTLNGTACSAG